MVLFTLEHKIKYFKEGFIAKKKIKASNLIIKYYITNDSLDVIADTHFRRSILRRLQTKTTNYSEGTKETIGFYRLKVGSVTIVKSKYLTFITTVNGAYHKLQLISITRILIYHFIHTVFYQNFGFPYDIYRFNVMLRTCIFTRVPTYKYLVQNLLI